MADKTKAELEAENEQLQLQVTSLAKEIAENPLSTDGNYQKELTRVNKLLEKAKDDFNRLTIKTRDEEIERITLANDAKATEERRLQQFGIRKLQQDEHTRFRAMARVPSGQRDIFGDPTTAVFDLGVKLERYRGGVYIPVPVVIEMAQSIGMLTKDQAAELNQTVVDTKARIEFAGNYAQELVDGITAHVAEFYNNLNSVVADGSGDVRDSDENDSDSGESAGQAPDSDLGSKSAGVPASDESESKSIFGNLK